MSEPSLPDKVLAISVGLESAGISYAFGGALALSYHAEPRTTVDIDVNVFIGPEQHRRIDTVLLQLGVESPADPARLTRDGWFRYRWGRNPVDVFFAELGLHKAMADARLSVPFGEDMIWIISAEHLTVCKALFDRPKDWLDIEQIAIGTPDLDRSEILGWIENFVGSSERTEKLRAILG